MVHLTILQLLLLGFCGALSDGSFCKYHETCDTPPYPTGRSESHALLQTKRSDLRTIESHDMPISTEEQISTKATRDEGIEQNVLEKWGTSTVTDVAEPLGFFYWTFVKEREGRMSLESVRQFHPTAPIYILGDQGGVNYTDFCMQLEVKYPEGRCKFVMAATKLGHDFDNGKEAASAFAEVDGRITEYFHQMERAAEWTKAVYLVRMQEDVRVVAKISTPTQADADIGSLHNTWTPPLSEELMKFFEENSPAHRPPAWPHVSCLGYIRSSAIRNMVHNYLRKADWYNLQEMYHTKPELSSWNLSDDTIVLLLGSLAGQSFMPWDQICEVGYENCCDKKVAIVHKADDEWTCSK